MLNGLRPYSEILDELFEDLDRCQVQNGPDGRPLPGEIERVNAHTAALLARGRNDPLLVKMIEYKQRQRLN